MQKILSNGEQITISASSFLIADELRIAIINCLNKTDLGFGKNFNLFDIENAFAQELNFEKIIKSALFLTADKKVLECFWECAKKAHVGKDMKFVNTEFFEHEENRELFIEIFILVLEVNVKSFFTGIIKVLKNNFPANTETET